MKSMKIVSVCTLVFISSSVVMADNDILNFSALTGEYVASNRGLEVALPYWKAIDNDLNGVMDGYNLHFDVYKLGSKTKLFSTPDKYLAYAIPACTGTQYLVDTKNVDFKRIGNNIVLTLSLNNVCWTIGRYTSHVYAVNISAAGKTPWFKSFPGKLLGTGILPDNNGDGVGELSVILESGIYNSIYVYDPETGASSATAQKYPKFW